MKIEQLLQPRFEVIGAYPKSKFKIGDILERIQNATNDWYNASKSLIDGDILLEEIEQYPNLFRKLEWWEKRDIKDMPEYVKCIYGETSLDYQRVYKVISWGLFKDEGKNIGNEGQPFANIEILNDTRTHDKGEIVTIHAKWLTPSTEEEYLNQ